MDTQAGEGCTGPRIGCGQDRRQESETSYKCGERRRAGKGDGCPVSSESLVPGRTDGQQHGAAGSAQGLEGYSVSGALTRNEEGAGEIGKCLECGMRNMTVSCGLSGVTQEL